jgi:broad specificity phosphatase PhoE
MIHSASSGLTTIFFLRHGEVHNPKKILYGRLPRFPLSRNGKEIIHKVKEQFKGTGINCIYASPMLRTRQTAHIIAKSLGFKPRISSHLIEVDLIFAGMDTERFKTHYQDKLYNRKNIMRGQESIETIGLRMLKFLTIVKKRHAGEKILVVSHGDPILILKAKLLGIPFTTKFKKANYLKTGEYFTLICDDNKYIWK